MLASVPLLATITIMTILGDYCIKLATNRDTGMSSPIFIIGALLYGIPAVGWFFLMKSHSLAMVGVMYSASTLILLTMLGYFVFKEALGLREVVGLSLAISAVIVMSGK
jgi:undecaprenyl phosphate-alpha-L-ara4N flippase subunit ArnF